MWSIKQGMKQGVKRLLIGEGAEVAGLLHSVDDVPAVSDPGRIAVRGWVLDPGQQPVVLELQMDGKLLCSFRPQVARPDVAAVYPESQYSLFSGFVIPFEMQLLARIPADRLQLVARSSAVEQLLWQWQGVEKEDLEDTYLSDASILTSVAKFREDNPGLEYDPHWLTFGEVEAFYHSRTIYRDSAPAEINSSKGRGAQSLHVLIEYSGSPTRIQDQINELIKQFTSAGAEGDGLRSLTLLVERESDLSTVEQIARRSGVADTAVLLKSSFPGWRSFKGSGSSTEAPLILYASCGVELCYADLNQLVSRFTAHYGPQLMAPVPLGRHTNLSGPVGFELGDLKGDTRPLFFNTSRRPPVWVATLSFLQSLEPEGNCAEAGAASGLYLPPVDDAFTYHLDLCNPVLTTSKTEFKADRDSIFLVKKAYEDAYRDLLSAAGDTVFLTLSADVLDAAQCSELAAQLIELASGFQAAGKRVIPVVDDSVPDEHEAYSMFGAFTPVPLSQFPALANWSGESLIVAGNQRALPAASLLRYLTGADVVQVFSSRKGGVDSRPADERSIIEWATRADFPALLLHAALLDSESSHTDALVVPLIPDLKIAQPAQSGKVARQGIVFNFAGRQLDANSFKLIADVVERCKEEPQSEPVTLIVGAELSAAVREQRAGDHWSRCLELADSCLASPDAVERQELLACSRVFVDLGSSVQTNVFAIEALLCGAFPVVSDVSGPLYGAHGGDWDQSRVKESGAQAVLSKIKYFLQQKELPATPSDLPKTGFSASEARDLQKRLHEAERELVQALGVTRAERRAVSVIVPIYCALDSVQMCVRSLQAHCPSSYQILLVNDRSDFGTSAWLRSYVQSQPQFELVELNENQGFIGACAAGLEAADPDNDIVIVNSDVVVTSSSFELTQAAAYKNERTGIASPLSTGSPHFQLDLNCGDTLESAAHQLKKLHKPVYPTAITPEGQFIYIRRHVLDRFGFFDRCYGRGFFEESDLCMRAFLNGVDTVTADNALVFHRRAASFGSESKNIQLEKNAPIFFGRWMRYWEKAYERFRAADVVAGVVRSYRSTAAVLERPEKPFVLEQEFERFEQLASDRAPVLSGHKVLGDAQVVFILPSIIVGGGTLSVLQHVNELIEQGIEARLVSLQEPELGDYPLLTAPIVVSPEQLFELDWSSQSVVATYWFTSYLVKGLVSRYPELNGFYYVQDYEPWFYPRSERFKTVQQAERSYELGLPCVVKTEFLRQTLHKCHNIKATLITPGVHTGVFYPGTQEQDDDAPVLTALLRQRTPRRGVGELLEMLKIVTDRVPELKVKLFGDKEGVPEELMGRVELLGPLSQSGVGKLYRQSDILVDLSHWHGFGRMGIEAMACGAVPVLTRSGGIDRYAYHGENALLCDVGDYKTAAEQVITLACDRELRLKLRSSGLSSVVAFNETAACRDWIDVFGFTRRKVVEFTDRKSTRLNGAAASAADSIVQETGS